MSLQSRQKHKTNWEGCIIEKQRHSDARTKDVFKSHAGGCKIFGWEQIPPA